MLRGEWERGWVEYQWRFSLPDSAPLMPSTAQPRWDGTPFDDGTVLLIADQGFGDVIHFSRYIPWTAQRCPNIAVACSAEMNPIIRQVYPSAALFNSWRGCPSFRAYRALSGLPALHGTRPDHTIASAPYLRADPARAATWRQRLDRLARPGSRRIGVVWAGRPAHNNDRMRSATLAAFAPIASLPNVTLVSLQKGPAADQVRPILRCRAPAQPRAGDQRFRRHDGDPRRTRSARDRRHHCGPPCRSLGPSSLHRDRLRTGLALAAWPLRYALVQLRASVPSDHARPLG